MRQDIKLKGKLKGYTQTPLMLTLLFAAMDVWMYVLNVKAGILGTIFVAIYFFCHVVCLLEKSTDSAQ